MQIEILENKWGKILSKFEDPAGRLLNILNLVQEEEGYLSRDFLSWLSRHEGFSESQIYGLITFFNSYRLKPCGKHRYSVCYGTACYVRGAPQIYDRLADELNIDEDGNTPDGLITLETVYCVGACSRAPVAVLDGEIKGKLNISQSLLMAQELKKK